MKQIQDLISPDQGVIKNNEDNTFSKPFFKRFLGFSIATSAGYGALLKTIVLSTGLLSGPVFATSLIGFPLMLPFWLYFSRGLRELMCQQSPWIKMPVMFLFHASMAILSGFIGLAILTACTSVLGVNPLVLPCLIAVAIAGAIVFASAMAVICRTQYIAPKNEQTLTKLPGIAWQALYYNNPRPFNSQIPRSGRVYENKLMVAPFGKKKHEMPEAGNDYEVRSVSRFFGSLFYTRMNHNEAVLSGIELTNIEVPVYNDNPFGP